MADPTKSVQLDQASEDDQDTMNLRCDEVWSDDWLLPQLDPPYSPSAKCLTLPFIVSAFVPGYQRPFNVVILGVTPPLAPSGQWSVSDCCFIAQQWPLFWDTLQTHDHRRRQLLLYWCLTAVPNFQHFNSLAEAYWHNFNLVSGFTMRGLATSSAKITFRMGPQPDATPLNSILAEEKLQVRATFPHYIDEGRLLLTIHREYLESEWDDSRWQRFCTLEESPSTLPAENTQPDQDQRYVFFGLDEPLAPTQTEALRSCLLTN